MKKLLLGLMVLCLSMDVYAQSDDWQTIKGKAFLRCGHNVLEKQQIGMVGLFADVGFLRLAFELGVLPFGENLSKTQNLLYFQPAIGVTFGKKGRCYALIGSQPWFKSDQNKEVIFGEIFLPRLETGYNLYIGDVCFFNFSTSYLCLTNLVDTEMKYHYLSLQFGFGANF